MAAPPRQEDVQAAHRRRVPALRVGAHLRGGGPERRAGLAQGRRATRSSPRAARSRSGPAATAYNRGQVLYRVAEMMEARAAEFAELCDRHSDEVERAIDRWVWYAGFADKLSQVLGSLEPGGRAVLQLHRSRADRRRRRSSRRRAAAARPRLTDRAGARRRQRRRRARVRDEPARRGRARRGARDERRSRRRRQHPHRPPRRAGAVARLAHGRERDRPHRRRRPQRRARASQPPTT